MVFSHWNCRRMVGRQYYERRAGFGLVGDLVVGVIGSFIGGYLFSFFGFSAYGTIGEIIMATIGAIVLLFVIRLFKKFLLKDGCFPIILARKEETLDDIFDFCDGVCSVDYVIRDTECDAGDY